MPYSLTACSTSPEGMNHTERRPAFFAPSMSEVSESPTTMHVALGSPMHQRQASKYAFDGFTTPRSSLMNSPSRYLSRPVDAIRPLALIVAPLVMI